MEVIKNKRGSVAPSLARMLITLVILLGVALTFAVAFYRISTVKDAANAAICSVCADNVATFYGGSREGNGYAKRASATGDKFTYSISTADVAKMLAANVGGKRTGDTVITAEKFNIKNLTVTYVNRSGNNLNFTASFTIELKAKVLKYEFVFPYQTEVKASYEQKF